MTRLGVQIIIQASYQQASLNFQLEGWACVGQPSLALNASEIHQKCTTPTPRGTRDLSWLDRDHCPPLGEHKTDKEGLARC